jgi:hypothetical protein
MDKGALMDNGCMHLRLMGDGSVALFDWLQSEGVRVLPEKYRSQITQKT